MITIRMLFRPVKDKVLPSYMAVWVLTWQGENTTDRSTGGNACLSMNTGARPAAMTLKSWSHSAPKRRFAAPNAPRKISPRKYPWWPPVNRAAVVVPRLRVAHPEGDPAGTVGAWKKKKSGFRIQKSE
jgi:hypothetical protein